MRAFEGELLSLGETIVRMGCLVRKQLADAIDVLKQRDLGLAERVISADGQVDRAERDIEEQVIALIARRQPMALDLREVMAAVRISSDLERVGDLAKNIARRVLAIGTNEHPQRLVRGVEQMSKLALKQLEGRA